MSASIGKVTSQINPKTFEKNHEKTYQMKSFLQRFRDRFYIFVVTMNLNKEFTTLVQDSATETASVQKISGKEYHDILPSYSKAGKASYKLVSKRIEKIFIQYMSNSRTINVFSFRPSQPAYLLYCTFLKLFIPLVMYWTRSSPKLQPITCNCARYQMDQWLEMWKFQYTERLTGYLFMSS